MPTVPAMPEDAASIGAEKLSGIFARVFAALERASYHWQTATPERLMKMRKSPSAFSALVRYFGLGLPVHASELEQAGLPLDLFQEVEPLRLAVSRGSRRWIAHSHWPADPEFPESYVYLGQESWELLRRMEARKDELASRSFLDLGSGSGVLSLELSEWVGSMRGIELSARAAEWAQASALAQGIANARFSQGRIGDPLVEAFEAPADGAVFNPPLAIPTDDPRPHRDGGKLGIEIPLAFLAYSHRHLKPGGEVHCMTTNPLVRGRPQFFDQVSAREWSTLEAVCVDDRFNQTLYRKEGYAALGVERIELWYLRLRKK